MTCSGRTQGAVGWTWVWTVKAAQAGQAHTADLWGVALRLLLVPELPVCVHLNYSVNELQTKKMGKLSSALQEFSHLGSAP